MSVYMIGINDSLERIAEVQDGRIQSLEFLYTGNANSIIVQPSLLMTAPLVWTLPPDNGPAGAVFLRNSNNAGLLEWNNVGFEDIGGMPDFTGQAGRSLVVNDAEDGLDFGPFLIDDGSAIQWLNASGLYSSVQFVDLSDTPSDFGIQAGAFLKTNATLDGVDYGFVLKDTGDGSQFLTDDGGYRSVTITEVLPDMTGEAGKVLQVNSTEDGVEYGIILKTSGDGTTWLNDQGTYTAVPGDNLGDHILTQDLIVGTNALRNQAGDTGGLGITANGDVLVTMNDVVSPEGDYGGVAVIQNPNGPQTQGFSIAVEDPDNPGEYLLDAVFAYDQTTNSSGLRFKNAFSTSGMVTEYPGWLTVQGMNFHRDMDDMFWPLQDGDAGAIVITDGNGNLTFSPITPEYEEESMDSTDTVLNNLTYSDLKVTITIPQDVPTPVVTVECYVGNSGNQNRPYDVTLRLMINGVPHATTFTQTVPGRTTSDPIRFSWTLNDVPPGLTGTEYRVEAIRTETQNTVTVFGTFSPTKLNIFQPAAGGGGAPTTYLSLTDTINTFAGAANRVQTVNAGESAVGNSLAIVRDGADDGYWINNANTSSALFIGDDGTVGAGTKANNSAFSLTADRHLQVVGDVDIAAVPAGNAELTFTATTDPDSHAVIYDYVPADNKLSLRVADGNGGTPANLLTLWEADCFSNDPIFAFQREVQVANGADFYVVTGSVGIGIDPETLGSTKLGISSNGNVPLDVRSAGTTRCLISLRDANTTGTGYVGIAAVANDMAFYVGGPLRARWYSNGNFVIGGSVADSGVTLKVNSGNNLCAGFETTGSASRCEFTLQDPNTTGVGFVSLKSFGDNMEMAAGGSSRIRISEQGSLLVNNFTPPSNARIGLFLGAQASAPAIATSLQAGIYTRDVAGTAELFAINSGNVSTQLTRHPKDAPDWFYEEKGRDLVTRDVDVERGVVRWTNDSRIARFITWIMKLLCGRAVVHEETFEQYRLRTGVEICPKD